MPDGESTARANLAVAFPHWQNTDKLILIAAKRIGRSQFLASGARIGVR
jgi:hypothetical protein